MGSTESQNKQRQNVSQNQIDAPVLIDPFKKMREDENSWSFDVILLEQLTKKRPLESLGMKIFPKFNAFAVLQTDGTTLRNWLNLIESNYHASNPYHTSTHAADVLQATAFFLDTPRLKEMFGPVDKVVCLLSAIVHDVGHPGKTNPFLINSRDELAILYNDLSVLESHHASLTFRLTANDPQANILKNLDPKAYKLVRQGIIDMVLATDMAKHFDHLAKFNEVFRKSFSKADSGLSAFETPEYDTLNPAASSKSIRHDHESTSTLATPENITLVKRILIKAADVSNPTRPLKQCVEWARRIAEEYFRQTDEENSKGLPVVLPMFERKNCIIPKTQMGFVDFFVTNLIQAWNSFLDIPELLDNMKYNYEYWKYLEKKGVRDAILVPEYEENNKPKSRNSK